MMPRLGKKFNLPIEVVAKTRDAYQSLTYADLNLPKAPAIMLGGEVLVAGRDIGEQELEEMIRQAMAAHK